MKKTLKLSGVIKAKATACFETTGLGELLSVFLTAYFRKTKKTQRCGQPSFSMALVGNIRERFDKPNHGIDNFLTFTYLKSRLRYSIYPVIICSLFA